MRASRSRLFAAILPGLAALLLWTGTAGAQAQRRKHRPEHDPGDAESINREQGVGEIPLGATARGRIVLGFFNMISFEAVRGTRVTLELRTHRKRARLLADLLPPGRMGSVKLKPRDDSAQTLVLTDHVLSTTGLYTIRFGFNADQNGDYTLTTTASYPKKFVAAIELPAGGQKTISLPGMSHRRIHLMTLEMVGKPVKMQWNVTILDGSGTPIDLSSSLRAANWGRRMEITNVPIESNREYRVRLEAPAGHGGTVRIRVTYQNPPLSRKSFRI